MLEFALCADDYGYRPGVDAAIRDLAAAGRLSATSALVTFPGWDAAARHVGDLAAHVDVGLHLNLVEGAPLGPMPRLAPEGRLPGLAVLTQAALTGSLDADEIRGEIGRQVERFVAATGRRPDFVDGHQHAHALPGVGRLVLSAMAEALPGPPVPVRDPSDRFARILRRGVARGKALTISALTHGFARLARKRHVPINDGFSGVYDFAATADLDQHFAAFLSSPGPRHLVMCHPGYDTDGTTPDPIPSARAREADYLASPAFAARLAAANAHLVRFTRLSLRGPDGA